MPQTSSALEVLHKTERKLAHQILQLGDHYNFYGQKLEQKGRGKIYMQVESRCVLLTQYSYYQAYCPAYNVCLIGICEDKVKLETGII